MDEQQLKDLYREAGVDLKELQDTPAEEPAKEPEPKDDPKPEEVPEKEETPTETDQDEPLQAPKEQRKRSIYDDLKQKKQEVKTERELREQAERERDELRQKLANFESAATPAEKQDAADDIEAFAKKINADPNVIREMRQLFIKDANTGLTAEERAQLQELQQFKAQQSQVIEKQLFEEEFASIAPTLKEMFPTASDEEKSKLKEEIDRLSHSKDWHDKDLDYVVFKNRTHLEKLVSPKKRGIEPRDRKDAAEETFEFDPSADYSKMTPKQREQWEAAYTKATRNDGLLTDGEGRKLII